MISLPMKDSLCYVLSVSPFKEDSAVITFVGEHGLFSGLAKGIYKPKSTLKSLLIIPDLVKVDYRQTSDGLNLISSVQVIEDNSLLCQDYGKSCFLFFLQELSLVLFKYGDSYPSDEIYQLLSSLKNHDDILSYSILLLGIFYRSLGIDVKTDCCLYCQKTKNIVSYDLQKGGFICKDCLHDGELVPELKLYILKYAFSSLSKSILDKKVPKKEGKEVLSELLNHLIDYFDLKPIRSFSLLLEAIDND